MARTLVIISSAVQTSSGGIAISDRAALGLALGRLAGSVVVGCPAADERAMVYALAAGAPDVRSLTDIEAEPFEVALVGYGALDQAGEQLAGLFAERNRAALVFDVLDVERSARGLVVTKDLGRGRREEWTLDGPAVLVVSSQARRPPYVSMYRRQAAIDTLGGNLGSFAAAAAAGPSQWQPARPRAKLGRGGQKLLGAAGSRLDEAFGLDLQASSGSRAQILEADPATCARQLLRYLAHHGFVEPEVSGGAIDRAAVASEPQSGVTRSNSPTAYAVRGPRRGDESPERIARRPRQSVPQPPPTTAPPRCSTAAAR